MCRKMIVVLMLLSMTSLASAVWDGGLLTNGSFEVAGGAGSFDAPADWTWGYNYFAQRYLYAVYEGDWSVYWGAGASLFQSVPQALTSTDVVDLSLWVFPNANADGKLKLLVGASTFIGESVAFSTLPTDTWSEVTLSVSIASLGAVEQAAAIGAYPTAFIEVTAGSGDYDAASLTIVPEPATMTLLGLGGLGLLRRRRS